MHTKNIAHTHIRNFVNFSLIQSYSPVSPPDRLSSYMSMPKLATHPEVPPKHMALQSYPAKSSQFIPFAVSLLQTAKSRVLWKFRFKHHTFNDALHNDILSNKAALCLVVSRATLISSLIQYLSLDYEQAFCVTGYYTYVCLIFYLYFVLKYTYHMCEDIKNYKTRAHSKYQRSKGIVIEKLA